MSSSSVHILIASLVLAGLVFLSVVGVLQVILDWGRTGANFLLSPLEIPLEKLKIFFHIFITLKDLSIKNEFLTRQVGELTAEVAGLEKIKQENRFLREALGFYAQSGLSLIPAEVIAWDALNVDSKVTLNRGQKHGVAKGSGVVIANGILVGVISTAFTETSQMDLLTSSAVVVNAEVVPSGTSGLVKGEHGLGLSFDLVSQNEVIKSGDRLVTSGLGGLYPKNLLIGEIGKINSSESELFQRASVIPATDLRKLRVVFVIKND